MNGDSSEDLEALVPRNRAIFGLKVADAEEAATVTRVSVATLGFTVLLLLDFVVHLVHDGNILHWLSHLVIPTVLLVAGNFAVLQRSTKAAWVFHVGSVLLGLTHAALLMIVVLSVLMGELEGAACSVRPRCPSEAEAPWIVARFVLVSVPVIGLSLFAAYHSQEFYMHLRLKRFRARAEGSTPGAVVFETEGEAKYL